MKSVKLIAIDHEGTGSFSYWVGGEVHPPGYEVEGNIIKIYFVQSSAGRGTVTVVCDFGEDIGIDEIIYPHCWVLYYIPQEETS